MTQPFIQDISRLVWESKYRFQSRRRGRETTVYESWQRVADAVAGAEKEDRGAWSIRFRQALNGFRFLPGGRILAGAGTPRRVTLFNCFVMGVLEDSLDGIFGALREGALTMQQGGGVGYDFSTLRPAGSHAHTTGTIASGPVSFMQVWDAMCATLLSTGSRRGAMMATLRCDHPDIGAFVEAKRTAGALKNFNLSVQVTDEFMQAVARGDDWPLVFPAAQLDGRGLADSERIRRRWTGHEEAVPCAVFRSLPARELWENIVRGAYDYAEPGVLFVDTINRNNNLGYREHLTATNPCGEIPLPPYGACNLGSINLTRFVRDPYGEAAALDLDAIARHAATATRFLDDVIDVSEFPLEAQADQARGTRRIGLGVTGLGDALIMLGKDYDSDAGREAAASVMRLICHTAYRTSVELAREKGAFPFLQRDRYLGGEFISALPNDIREGIAGHGIRNSHLTAIAPAGTISLLANNVSSGIEPVFAPEYDRRVLRADGTYASHRVQDYALAQWRKQRRRGTPPCYACAHELPPRAHLEMLKALQPYVDNAISKTVNVPQEFPFEQFASLYESAWRAGLKGCTAFRLNPVTGAILELDKPDAALAAPHCCSIEREAD
ncbi:MAG TPA: adenosylcobalamin-dependent ribonucleoside-diphosphate reductase [Gammaproteobacteria bacterium]|nr:adenosylcobalamin-dependent ribonucleoside-diphosphate reductase [Gammaproteobacteria bacterium]